MSQLPKQMTSLLDGAKRIYDRKIISLSDVLDFGKHEGEDVDSVIRSYPYYIQWCVETINNFKLDEEADELLTMSLFRTKFNNNYVDYTGNNRNYNRRRNYYNHYQ